MRKIDSRANALGAHAAFSGNGHRQRAGLCRRRKHAAARRTPHEPSSNDEHAPPYEWRTVGDATVVVIRRFFGSPEDKRLLERLPSDYDQHRKHSTIVFDFRGNGGGNDSYVYRWIDNAVRRDWPKPFFGLEVTGAELACGFWNDLVLDQIRYDRVDDTDAKAERDAFISKTPLGVTEALPVQALDVAERHSDARTPYRGRVFALVDHAAGSSGETAPDALHLALGAPRVGERTAGYMELGNVLPYLMPRTGVAWQLASKRKYYAEPRDGVGLPVDVYLDADLVEAPVETMSSTTATRRPRTAGTRAGPMRSRCGLSVVMELTGSDHVSPRWILGVLCRIT